LPLARLMGGFYATCLLFIFGVLGVIAWMAGFSIWRLIKYIKEEILIVLGTSSSEAALPGLIKKLEDLGCAKSVTGLVIPTGYSFNLDGTCIYLVMATVFLAQATNTPLTVMHQLAMIGVLLITSKGAAGVAGAALIVLAATLASLGTIPVASMTLILGIHRFMGEAISITNLIGNAVATIVVSKWDGALDHERMMSRLGPRPSVEQLPV
jgi:aerobic C4-dicarboxylate transport protein